MFDGGYFECLSFCINTLSCEAALLFFRKKNTATEPDIRTPEGFEQVYNAFVDKLYGICRSNLNSKEAAEEIVQDVFLSLWERKDRIEIKESLERYLTRAAKLKIIDYLRRKARNEKHMTSFLDEHSHADDGTEQAIAYNELHAQITELVNRLPFQSKEVFKLSREKGLSNKEIASVLLISEKTVEYHMKKALAYMRNHLIINQA